MQISKSQTVDMTAEHFRAIESPDEFGCRVEIADMKIAIDDHHGIVRPLERRELEIRSFDHRRFDHWVIVCAHHPTLVPVLKPSRRGPGGETPFW